MLRAKVLYKDKSNKQLIVGYELKGHVGYAASGKDIVCAGISTAAHMTLLSLDRLGIEYDSNISIGYNKVKLRSDTFLFTAQQPFHVLVNYLNELMKQYPNHVSIERLTESL